MGHSGDVEIANNVSSFDMAKWATSLMDLFRIM